MNNNTKKIGEVIKKLVVKQNLKNRLDNVNALEAFEEIIGKQLYKYISESKIYQQKLIVRSRSASLRNEISYSKTDIINQINKKLQAVVVKEIIIR
tara:strand:- start:256 stop:543 length:288 start_codon:yes stop_codon:yes gene_type:complete